MAAWQANTTFHMATLPKKIDLQSLRIQKSDTETQ